ncbi:MAG: hypothetical protein ACOH18_00935 [Candidatus Saccharimonadaceae bacterium]
MRKNTKVVEKRNWLLVFISIILILIGGALVVLAVANIGLFGWWSIPVGVGGLITITAAILSIVKNDPSFILLDLLLQGW